MSRPREVARDGRRPESSGDPDLPAVLAAQADAVLVVIRAGQTERQSAHYAISQLRAIGARIVGAVLNDPDQKIAGYGKYAYYYDYYTEAAD